MNGNSLRVRKKTIHGSGKRLGDGQSPPLITDIPAAGSFAVLVIVAKEHAPLGFDLVGSQWIMITWPVEIDGVARCLIENGLLP